MTLSKASCFAVAAVVGMSTSLSVRAAILEDFQFGDADFTALSAAVNSANAGNQWVEDSDHSPTIQVIGGSLNIVKNNTDFVTEGLGIADVSSGVLWMVAEFKDWALLGSAPDGNNVEEIRFGFMATEDLSPPPSSTNLAEMMISRNFTTGNMQISGSALGAGGSSIAAAPLNNIQNDPFVMAMKVDQDTDTYTIYYKDGAGPVSVLGSGTLEPSRDAIIVRMTINNFWGDEAGEFANLDRFYISDTTPSNIPEPASLALLGLGGLALGRRSVRR
jgi:hypothetical protein